jgi:hypothetical protein
MRGRNQQNINLRLATFYLKTNHVIATVETGEEKPNQIALLVKRLISAKTNSSGSPGASETDVHLTLTGMREAMKARNVEESVDWKTATWIPFTNTISVDLGPGDGERAVWISGKWGEQFRSASRTRVWVDNRSPVVVITNPVERLTSQPWIQLQGYSDEALRSIRYDLVNASHRIENQQGLINEQDRDPASFEITRSYFTCYDLDMAPGTNTIVLRCEDLAGNVSTNLLTYVFSLDHDKTPPVISLDLLSDGQNLSGDAFTARGVLDDPTARMTGIISANGRTNFVAGLVERNGYFWVERLPLGFGTNRLTLIATDVAGNSSSTNLVVSKSEELLTMDPVPEGQLSRHHVSVSGKVSPADREVWVNGVQATVKPDGSWAANNVPIQSRNGGGVATFVATSIPLGKLPTGPVDSRKRKDLVSVVTTIATNAVTLNAGQPACDNFNLHLTGVAGRSFVLLASTNLADWTPILTNLNSKPRFDYKHTNMAAYPCRFFRVVPLP